MNLVKYNEKYNDILFETYNNKFVIDNLFIDSFSKEDFDYTIKQDDNLFVLIDENEKPLCFIGSQYFDIYNKKCDLFIFLSDEKYSGKGYGRICLEKYLNFLKLNDMKRIELEVYERNINAIKLYEKIGFEKEIVFQNLKTKNGKKENIILYSFIT